MKNIEDLIVDKIYEFVNCALAKFIKPDIKINKVTELNEEAFDKIKEQYGIEAVILDVDETIRKNMRKIPQCNQEWIEQLKEKFKVIVVSNGVDRKIEQFFTQREIDYIGFARKPLKTNFLKACQKLGVEPSKVLVIGDSLFADIHGGKRNNMRTVLVKKVETDMDKEK